MSLNIFIVVVIKSLCLSHYYEIISSFLSCLGLFLLTGFGSHFPSSLLDWMMNIEIVYCLQSWF